jgi:hypothetical protein
VVPRPPSGGDDLGLSTRADTRNLPANHAGQHLPYRPRKLPILNEVRTSEGLPSAK